MPRQRGSEKRKLDGGQAQVRMTADLADRVAAAADRAGLSSSAWLRSLAVAAVGADPVDAVPTLRPTPPRPAPTVDVVEVARLREVVAELSGALVRVAVRTRAGGLDELHAAVEAVLPDVKSAVRGLDRLKAELMPPPDA